jgi:hypothetical protein
MAIPTTVQLLQHETQDTGESSAAAAQPTDASAASPSPQPAAAQSDVALAAPFAPLSGPTRRPAVVPLAADQYKVTFTAPEATWRKLQQAQELLRHQVPHGDLAEVIDRALGALLEQLTRRRFAAVTHPRSTEPGAFGGRGISGESPVTSGRHIPAEVRRTVWMRDGGSCGFVGTDGRRCGDRTFVEFHHLRPFAVGGPPTTENIALRCRSHNGHEAELYFGPGRRWAIAQPP